MIDKSFFTKLNSVSLSKILEVTKAICLENKDISFNDVASLNNAKSDEISVFFNIKYLKDLKSCKAAACFVSEKFAKYVPNCTIKLISANPYKAWAQTLELFYLTPQFEKKITSNIIIPKSAIIGDSCFFGSGTYIGENVKIGDNCSIGCNSYIGYNTVIGNNCTISNNVTITHTIMGDNNIIHTGAVIGKAGFGFASDMSGHYHVLQLGRVLMGSGISIGANSCIDRGSTSDTVIGDYCMIDNLVQIGHNVKLGKACILVAMVGIAGSTNLGDFVVVGGQVGIAGHLKIGNNVQIAAGSGVAQDIKAKEIYGGYPAVPVKSWHRQSITLKKLVNKTGDKNE